MTYDRYYRASLVKILTQGSDINFSRAVFDIGCNNQSTGYRHLNWKLYEKSGNVIEADKFKKLYEDATRNLLRYCRLSSDERSRMPKPFIPEEAERLIFERVKKINEGKKNGRIVLNKKRIFLDG